jgi:hypothetical protein
MHVTVKPLDPEMVAAMTVQAAQGDGMSVEILRALANGCPAFMALDGDEVIAAAGIVEQWKGRAIAWSTLAPNLGSRMIAVHRAVVRFLDGCGFRRVEMFVACGHVNGERWAKALGFVREGKAIAALPDGSDAWFYARVRNG